MVKEMEKINFNNDYRYIGSELEIAREAKNWKNYFCSLIYQYLGNEVLEVGAGMGVN